MEGAQLGQMTRTASGRNQGLEVDFVDPRYAAIHPASMLARGDGAPRALGALRHAFPRPTINAMHKVTNVLNACPFDLARGGLTSFARFSVMHGTATGPVAAEHRQVLERIPEHYDMTHRFRSTGAQTQVV